MIDRRRFMAQAPLAAAGTAGIIGGQAGSSSSPVFRLGGHAFLHPLAITMWDFSWIERRWPGAGYEDWDDVLD
jgi:hypothetical protein